MGNIEDLSHVLARLERKIDHIMSTTDPLQPAITTLSNDVGTLQTQNQALIALVQKLASAGGVNTAADLAAIQAEDATVTGITAADVAAVAAQAPPVVPPPAT